MPPSNLPTPPAPEPGQSFESYMDSIKKYALQTLAFTLAIVVAGVLTRYVVPTPASVVQPAPAVEPALPPVMMDPPREAMGWVDRPDEVAIITSTLPLKVFGDTDAGKSLDALPDHVYLWDATRKLTGEPGKPQNQGSVGSCTGFGGARSIERTLSAQIVSSGGFEFRMISEEVLYAGSRVEIGGGRLNGDGSTGGWIAKFAIDYGAAPKAQLGSYDLTNYDQSRARQWGNSGVPNDLEPEVKKFGVKTVTKVTSWAEAKRALANGYGVMVCSDQGFTRQRDSNGVCKAQGQWMHCMAFDGYHVEGGKEYGHIENSWGPDYHVGPTGWGSPNTAGFWADSSVIDRMLRQGDSWTFSAVQGFPKKKIDWFFDNEPAKKVKLQLRQRDLFALAY